MYYTIYRIINSLNNKTYIGKHQTDNLNNGYMGSGKYLKHAMDKHGIDKFSKEILFVFDTEAEMNAKEKELVTESFCARNDTYNLCEGGKGGFGFINQHRMGIPHFTSETSRQYLTKAYESKMKLLQDESWAANYSQKLSKSVKKHFDENGHPWSGRKHSEETKQKMSKPKNIGSTNPQFGSMWITNGNENRKIKKLDTIPENWYKGRTIK